MQAGKLALLFKEGWEVDSNKLALLLKEGWEVENYNKPRAIDLLKNTNSSVHIFPNPADNNVHVEFVNELSGPINGSIVDITGKEIISFRDYLAEDRIQTIDVSSLKSGIYFIIMQYSTQKIHHKLSIAR